METLKQIICQTRALEKIEGSRLGKLVKVDLEKNQIWIDYEGNPFSKPLLAKLGTPWVSNDELKLFNDRIDAVKLEFSDGNPTQPIIRDLFFSVSAMNRSKSQPLQKKVLVIEAEEIIIKGHKQVTIQSGNAKTVYQSEGAVITQEAEQIDSAADTNLALKGGSILLN